MANSPRPSGCPSRHLTTGGGRNELTDAKFPMEFASGVYGVQMFTIRREQGRLAEVAPVLRRFIDENPRDAAWRPGMALIASDLGFRAAARKAFDDLAASGFEFPVDAKRSLTLSYLAEVCARLADAEHAELLYDLLLPYQDLAIVAPIATVCCGSASRFLGMLASTTGNWAAAEGRFQAALDMDERLHAWPWLAHTKYEYALMLRERGRPRIGPAPRRCSLRPRRAPNASACRGCSKISVRWFAEGRKAENAPSVRRRQIADRRQTLTQRRKRRRDQQLVFLAERPDPGLRRPRTAGAAGILRESGRAR